MEHLACACGERAKSPVIINRTDTGRETVRSLCHKCHRISWWYVVRKPNYHHLLVQWMDRTDERKWPPNGWKGLMRGKGYGG